jgi:hypothetical protein
LTIAFGKKFQFFTDSIDPSAYDFFLLMTVDLIGIFSRQWILAIDPINVFLVLGADLWPLTISGNKMLTVTIELARLC